MSRNRGRQAVTPHLHAASRGLLGQQRARQRRRTTREEVVSMLTTYQSRDQIKRASTIVEADRV